LIESSPTALEISSTHLVTSMSIDATDIAVMTSIVSSSEMVFVVIKSTALSSSMANFALYGPGSPVEEGGWVLVLMDKARHFNALLDFVIILLQASSVLL